MSTYSELRERAREMDAEADAIEAQEEARRIADAAALEAKREAEAQADAAELRDLLRSLQQRGMVGVCEVFAQDGEPHPEAALVALRACVERLENFTCGRKE